MLRRKLLSWFAGATAARAATAPPTATPSSPCAAAAAAYRQGRIAQARALYQQAVLADPQCPAAHGGLGWIHFIEHRRLQAARLLGRAYQQAPNDVATVRQYAAASGDRALEAILLQRLIHLPATPAPERDRAIARLARRRRLAGRLLNELLSEYTSHVLPMPTGPHGWIVRVSLNGRRPLRLLLDTGARGLLLNHRSAEGLGLEPLGQSEIGGFGDQAGGVAQVALAHTFAMQGFRLANVLVESAGKRFVDGVDGVIGVDLFRHFQISLDGPRKQLILTPYPDADASAGADDHPWARFETSAYRPGFQPYRRVGHLILVEDRSVPGQQWVLDSGASYCIVHQEIPSLLSERIAMTGVSGPAQAWRLGHPLRFHLGDAPTWTRDAVGLDLDPCSEQLGLQIAGFLGFPVLRDRVLTIDPRAGAITLDHQAPAAGAAL